MLFGLTSSKGLWRLRVLKLKGFLTPLIDFRFFFSSASEAFKAVKSVLAIQKAVFIALQLCLNLGQQQKMVEEYSLHFAVEHTQIYTL